MQKSTFRRVDLGSRQWVLCFNIDFHTCINLFWQKKTHQLHSVPPKSTAPFITPNWQKWLGNVDETMIWQSAGYVFLKSETKFQTPDKKALIWDPVMVSMIKTQLTIRQNVNKVKIQISLLFFQLQIGFTCISCSRRLEISHRPCNLFQEGHFLHNLII